MFVDEYVAMYSDRYLRHFHGNPLFHFGFLRRDGPLYEVGSVAFQKIII
jgi:hypothetical protein